MIFGYVLVETLVFYAIAKWLGVGTALLLLLGVFFVRIIKSVPVPSWLIIVILSIEPSSIVTP